MFYHNLPIIFCENILIFEPALAMNVKKYVESLDDGARYTGPASIRSLSKDHYFETLNNNWWKISREGMPMRLSVPKKKFRPWALLLSVESKKAAEENRKALTNFNYDFFDETEFLQMMTDYVPQPLVNAYKKNTTSPTKDRSGGVLFEMMNRKWSKINRNELLLDPNKTDPILQIEDVVQAHRDIGDVKRWSLVPVRKWKLIPSFENNLEEACVPKTFTTEQLHKKLRSVAQRLGKAQPKSFCKLSPKEKLVHLQAFCAALEFADARLQTIIDPKEIKLQTIKEQAFQAYFIQTSFAFQRKQDEEFIAKQQKYEKAILDFSNAQKKLFRRRKIKSMEELKELSPTLVAFFRASQRNFVDFQGLLECDEITAKPWNSKTYTIRLATDQTIVLCTQLRIFIETTALEVRKLARIQTLGYASMQPCFEEVPEFHTKYPIPIRRQKRRDIDIPYTPLVDYERYRWGMTLGTQDITSMDISGSQFARNGGETFDRFPLQAILQWVFDSLLDPNFIRFAMPLGDSITIGIDLLTQQVDFRCRREEEFIKRDFTLSHLINRSQRKRILNALTYPGSGPTYLEWTLVTDDQYEELQASAQSATVLHWCINNDHFNSAARWVDSTADIDRVNELGNTALHLACQKNKKELVMQLLARKPSVDITNADGDTPLHICIGLGWNELAILLINSNADIRIKNKVCVLCFLLPCCILIFENERQIKYHMKCFVHKKFVPPFSWIKCFHIPL